jgi:DnaK suppressor protein
MLKSRPGTKNPPSLATADRTLELREMLNERQRELQAVLQRRFRQDPLQERAGQDEPERAESDIQEHVDVALTQMKGDTLQRVREALARLDAGEYGRCAECDAEITNGRLRALPFAVRCTICEDLHERANARQRPFGLMFGFAVMKDDG